MSHRILVNPGTPQAWEITLKPGVNRIGRDADNDFNLNHPSISSRHCEIMVSDAGVSLKDLGSASGTYINRAPVREVWLHSGQRIQFGAIEAIFESTQPANVAPPVSQPAPGATVIVAAVGSPPSSHPPASNGSPLEAPKTEVEPASTAASRLASAQTTGRPKRFPVHEAAEREAARRKRFLLGAVGATVGGLIGATAWYFLIKSTGATFALAAWGVGVVTGLGARMLAQRGNLALGVLSGFCALLAIIFGEYLAVKAIIAKEGAREANQIYQAQMIYARAALQAESTEELRKLLATANQKTPEEITDEQVRKFQEEELPGLGDFARGKPSKAEFTTNLSEKIVGEFDYQQYFFKDNLKSGLFLALFAVLGIATAYKLASAEEN